MLGAGYWVLGAGRWVLCAGYWVLGAGLWVQGAGIWYLVFGYVPFAKKCLELNWVKGNLEKPTTSIS